MKPINEASACICTGVFYGTNGAPFTPTSARYRLRNVTANRVLRDWTTMAINGSAIDIEIPASLNVIVNDRNLYEEIALSVQAEPGLDGQFTEEIRYKIKNLKGFK